MAGAAPAAALTDVGPPRLARVEVDASSETPRVTVGSGLRADTAGRICDAMIFDYHTDLRPDEPLVADRSVSDDPEG